MRIRTWRTDGAWSSAGTPPLAPTWCGSSSRARC